MKIKDDVLNILLIWIYYSVYNNIFELKVKVYLMDHIISLIRGLRDMLGTAEGWRGSQGHVGYGRGVEGVVGINYTPVLLLLYFYRSTDMKLTNSSKVPWGSYWTWGKG